jgi:branched-subunit amino acid aminotransferase/4-amino-4-deoxychorismate lyase
MTYVAEFGPGAQIISHLKLAHPRSSLRLEKGENPHLRAHIDRLKSSCVALGFAAEWIDVEMDTLRAWLAQRDGVLRLSVDPENERLIARLEPLPINPQPYRLILRKHPMPPTHPLASHKGLLGPWWKDLLEDARGQGAQDALLFWPDGSLAETCIAAIAWEHEGALISPPLRGRVASLAERLELPSWVRTHKLQHQYQAIEAHQIHKGTLWCLNAVRGIWQAEVMESP